MYALWLRDAADHGIADIQVTITPAPSGTPFHQVSNGDGWVGVDLPYLTQSVGIETRHPDYRDLTRTEPIADPMIPNGNVHLTLTPILPAILPLETRDRRFVTSAGADFVWCGFSLFPNLKQYVEGGPDAASPYVDQILDLCREVRLPWAPVFRVFRAAAPPNQFALDPRTYARDLVRAYAQWLLTKGARVEFTAGDWQILGIDPAWRRQELTEIHALCADLPNVLLEDVNEPFKNGGLSGWRPADRRILCSSGDYDDKSRLAHLIHYITFHGPRDGSDSEPVPKWVRDEDGVVYSGYTLPDGFHVPPIAVPWVGDEMKRFNEVEGNGSESADPEHAFQLAGKYALWHAGLNFHSNAGRDGQLFGPRTLDCARMHLRGLLAPTLGRAR